MYLAFDPGETTGWALFDKAGDIKEWGQLTMDELHLKLTEWESLDIDTVICEGFIIYRHKAKKFAGNRMLTIQVIGIVKSFAHRMNAKYVEQDSDILPIAQKHTQVFMPKDHSESHKVSAFNHGAEWLIRQGIRKTALEEEQNTKVKEWKKDCTCVGGPHGGYTCPRCRGSR